MRLSGFPLLQKFEKNSKKSSFCSSGAPEEFKNFLINFCIILKVLQGSNFLLLLCSRKRTKIFLHFLILLYYEVLGLYKWLNKKQPCYLQSVLAK